MDTIQKGYWDFYQDCDGKWHWRCASPKMKRVASCDQGYASSNDCLHDAISHGYNPLMEIPETRVIA